MLGGWTVFYNMFHLCLATLTQHCSVLTAKRAAPLACCSRELSRHGARAHSELGKKQWFSIMNDFLCCTVYGKCCICWAGGEESAPVSQSAAAAAALGRGAGAAVSRSHVLCACLPLLSQRYLPRIARRIAGGLDEYGWDRVAAMMIIVIKSQLDLSVHTEWLQPNTTVS